MQNPKCGLCLIITEVRIVRITESFCFSMVIAMSSLFLYMLLNALSIDLVVSFGSQSNRVFVSTPVSNLPKRSVADCMTTLPKVLYPNTSVDDTIAMLLNNGLLGAPVVNENMEIMGIVCSSDFLQKEAFEGALLPMEGTSEMVQQYVDAAKKICGQKVEDVMTSNPITVLPNMPMRQAAALMAEKKLHILPVVDGNNKLVGIVSSTDVMRDLIKIARELPAAAYGDKDELGPYGE
jgi:CBS domain-containing protein